MNWGNGILLVFVVFIGGMATLVTICMKQDDIHLVTENYYEEEIKYQEHIDKVSNANATEKQVMYFDGIARTVELELPKGATGVLHLFRPSDARLDKKILIEIKNTESKVLPLSGLEPGYWKMKMEWEANGMAFYEEKEIDL